MTESEEIFNPAEHRPLGLLLILGVWALPIVFCPWLLLQKGEDGRSAFSLPARLLSFLFMLFWIWALLTTKLGLRM